MFSDPITSSNQRYAGFSLIEISIVVAIVGLIVGVVLVGRNLIGVAERDVILDEGNRINQATHDFKERFNALPGDMWDASTRLGNLSGGGAATDGDGNGEIDTAAERLAFWQHLALAGFIDGEFDALTQAPGVGVMETSVDAAGGYRVVDVGGVTMIELSRFAAGAGGNAFMRPEDVWALDEKYDDGDPDTGNIQAIAGANNSGNCVDSGAYDLTNDGIACIIYLQLPVVAESGSTADAAEYAAGQIVQCTGGNAIGGTTTQNCSMVGLNGTTMRLICREGGVWELDTSGGFNCTSP